ncbi:toxin-antitoxin system YwqK family antitoxin [Gracilimonas sp. Q87]|uniref:toxin-antitoxin system YwqK family antitoxin n=1 Tax=Gracilimonas sp. Q87 TaxID=3384766 RepID=UPI0039845B93
MNRHNQLVPYSTHHPNGSLQTMGSLLKGKRHGIWNHFYPNGYFQKHEHYKMGKLDGTVRKYDLEFRVVSSVKYIDGDRV